MALTEVNSKGIKDADIATGDIADDAITSAKIADDAITSALIADDAITSALIADDAITSALIADDAVVTASIADDAITSALIADDAVVTAAIADNAITNALMADDAVGVAELSATGTARSSTFLRGDNSWAAAGGGKLVKVEHMSTTSSASSSDYDTWSDTNLTDTITMAQATNKLLVFTSLHCFLTDGTTYDYASIRMNNMGTQLVWTPDGGSATGHQADGADASGHYAFRLNWDDTNWPVKDMGGYLTRSYLIDPDTTTQLTVKLQMRPGRDNMTVHSSYGARSTMTIMEIEYDS